MSCSSVGHFTTLGLTRSYYDRSYHNSLRYGRATSTISPRASALHERPSSEFDLTAGKGMKWIVRVHILPGILGNHNDVSPTFMYLSPSSIALDADTHSIYMYISPLCLKDQERIDIDLPGSARFLHSRNSCSPGYKI